MKKPLLLAIILAAFSSVGIAQNSNTSISINIDGEETTVEITEQSNGETTTIHLDGDEAEAWMESNGKNYSYSYSNDCSKKCLSAKEKKELEEEIKEIGVQLEEELEDLSKYVDKIDVEELVEQIQESVEAIQEEIEINIRTSSDDKAVI